MGLFVLYTSNFLDVDISSNQVMREKSCSFLHGTRNIFLMGYMWSSSPPCWSEMVPGITLRLILQSCNVNLLVMVLVYSDGGFRNTIWLRLQIYNVKTASHGPCLFWWGIGNTEWGRLQSFSVKLLAMGTVYSHGGVQREMGITVFFGPKMFSLPKQHS